MEAVLARPWASEDRPRAQWPTCGECGPGSIPMTSCAERSKSGSRKPSSGQRWAFLRIIDPFSRPDATPSSRPATASSGTAASRWKRWSSRRSASQKGYPEGPLGLAKIEGPCHLSPVLEKEIALAERATSKGLHGIGHAEVLLHHSHNFLVLSPLEVLQDAVAGQNPDGQAWTAVAVEGHCLLDQFV